jgi:3-deoxy-manno-octulosonate cytidylyltransferase (CMP-KDO synthetase)
MKILGIIPARYASTRFPGKPLIDLKGKSMIQRVYEGASRSQALSEVIVATDDVRILEAVQAFGGRVEMTSESHPSGTDRCAEVAGRHDADVIVNIQGDEPLIDYRQLDELCAAFARPEVEIATLAKPGISEEERQNPNRIKVVLDADEKALYFSRSPIPNTFHAKKEALESYAFLRHIGVYAYRRPTLLRLTQLEASPLEMIESLEQLRWMHHGFPIHVVKTFIETPNIDVPSDVEQVLKALS